MLEPFSAMSSARIKAAALSPEIHEAMTEGKRFNFKLRAECGQEVLLTALASQDETPGVILIHDVKRA